MKKRTIVIFVCLMLSLTVMLSGCGIIKSLISLGDDSDDGPVDLTELMNLTAPKVSVTGCLIQWGTVDNATSYEVYSNDVLVTTTGDTYYICSDNTENKQFYVVAVNEELEKKSEESNTVMVCKQTGFSLSETMKIQLESGVYSIPATINYVTVSGSSSSAYIVVANRNTDLVISLNSVNMTSPGGKNCISTVDGSYSATAKKYNVIINVNGVNSLTAGDQTDIPAQPSDNTQAVGTTGYAGGNALNLASMVVTGGGSLTVTGGKGGTGGKGANAYSGLSSPGNGGDGGAGGNGIATTQMILCMDITGCVYAYGGEGGKGGSHGINGNVMSGLWNNLLDTMKDGSSGKKGTALVGNKKVYGGVYSG